MNFSERMVIALSALLLAVPPISGIEAVGSSIPAETDHIRVSSLANISELDAHSRLARWTFENLSQYENKNLTRSEAGVCLDFDPERYAGGIICTGSEVENFDRGVPSGQSDIAVNSKGEYIVVWITTTSNYLIGQGYHANGTPKGNEIDICKRYGSKNYPRIIFDSTDNYLVVWRDDRNPSGPPEIYGRKFDMNNNALGIDHLISYVESAGKTAICTNSKGEYILAWSMGSGIHLQMLDKNGSAFDDGLSLRKGSNGVSDPAMDIFSNDDFVIAWSEENHSRQEVKTHFQRFKADMTLLGDPVTVGSPAVSRASPSIAIDSRDRMNIVWQQEAVYYPIFSQKFDRDGNQLAGIDMICNDTGIAWTTDVAVVADDKYVITWSGKQSVGASPGTAVAQLFDENGTPIRGRIAVYEGDGYVRGPVIAPQPDGAFMMEWTHQFIDYGPPIVFSTYAYSRRFLQGAYAENGNVVTSDIEPEHLFCWGNITMNASFGNPAANRLGINYSINGGLNWTPVPVNRDLSKVNISTGRIRFRVDFSTSDSRTAPVLRALEFTFVENRAPVLVSLAPVDILNAYRLAPVNFRATATDPDDDVLVYDWFQTAGPGIFLEENGTATPYYIPYELGVYRFRLTVGDGFTKTAPSYANITVVNRPPAIQLWSDGRPYKNIPLKIHAKVVDPDEDEFALNWSLVESPPGALLESIAGLDPVLTCPAVGDCVVALRAVDSIGDESNATARYSFIGRDPVAVVYANRTAARPYAAFGFSGAGSSDPDDDLILYRFNFGDGNSTDWNATATASHGYPVPGNYTVRLECRDSDGNVSSATVNITVLPFNLPPVASFKTIDGNLTKPFQFSSTSHDPDGAVASYLWDFGDGTSGTGRTVSHQYPSGGCFTVVLIVTDDEGASGNSSYLVRINRPPVLSSFSPKGDQTLKSGQAAGFSIIATDPDGDALNCSWSVNGARAGNGTAFSFNFSSRTGGAYIIAARIEDGRGGTISHGWNVTVESVPKENINIGDISGYILLVVVIVMGVYFFILRSRRSKDANG